MLDPVLQSISCLTEWKVHLISLKLEVLLLLGELSSLFLQVLGTLLEGVLSQSGFSLDKSSGHILQLVSRVVDLILQHIVLLFEFLVLVTLLWVQVIKSSLVSELNLLDFLLIVLNLMLDISLLTEQVVQMGALLVILVLDVHVKSLNVIRLGVTAVLVEGKVVISEFSLELSDILDECLVLALEGKVRSVILVDVLDLLLHLVDLARNLIVLGFQEIVEVRSIVDLSTRALVRDLDTRHTMVSHWSIDGSDLGVVTNTRKVGFSKCGRLAHRSAHASSGL